MLFIIFPDKVVAIKLQNCATDLMCVIFLPYIAMQLILKVCLVRYPIAFYFISSYLLICFPVIIIFFNWKVSSTKAYFDLLSNFGFAYELILPTSCPNIRTSQNARTLQKFAHGFETTDLHA